MSKLKSGIGVFYVAMTTAAVALYLLVREYGLGLTAPPRAGLAPVAHTTGNELALVMVALAVITLSSRLLGVLMDRLLRQPPVIGEIIAGIVLGPSVLGLLAPGLSHHLFPPEVIPSLSIISKVGVVLFMFVIGLEIDAPALRRQTRATLVVSHTGIVVPFLLGSALALFLYPRYATGDISFTAFSLFLGISMSITAFPVLARILREHGVQRTEFGTTALACAAIDDVTAWTLLAMVVGIVTTTVTQAMTTLPLLVGYLLIMFFVCRPVFQWLSRNVEPGDAPVSTNVLTSAFVGLLLSAAATEYIGIHSLFGAFLFGVFLPHESRLAQALRTRIEDLVGIVFLPAFFAFTGLRTQLSLISGFNDWMACGLIVLVATLGKFGGAYAAARYSGLASRASAALGVLMNTRGLIELIVLNIGLDLGVISPRLFSMLVVMALVTTFATSPLFRVLMRGRGLEMSPNRAATGAAH